MKIIKMRTKQSSGKIPKGLELQVASNNSSPSHAEIAQALVRATGCDERTANSYSTYRGNFEVIK